MASTFCSSCCDSSKQRSRFIEANDNLKLFVRHGLTITWLDLGRSVAVMAWHLYFNILVGIRVNNEVFLLRQVMILGH